jgi:hypothetical protein
MAACNGDPMASIQADLGTASNNNSGQQQGSAGSSGLSPNPSVGNSGSSGANPVGSAMGDQGMTGDPIAGMTVKAPASGTTKGSFGQVVGFKATVSSNAYMSCGENQQDGDVGGALKYIKGEISGSKF